VVKRPVLWFGILGVLLVWATQAVTAENLVDPMRPADYRAARVNPPAKKDDVDTSSWKLTAVLSSANRQVAVVNGRSLQQGDSLEGFTVRKIEKDRIYLQKAKKSVVLRRVGTGLKTDIR
jgi:hypothetical protein